MISYLLPLVIGLVSLVAGLYQFRDQRLGGFRMVGVIDSDVDTDSTSEAETVFAKLVGVGLILMSLVFWYLSLYCGPEDGLGRICEHALTKRSCFP